VLSLPARRPKMAKIRARFAAEVGSGFAGVSRMRNNYYVNQSSRRTARPGPYLPGEAIG